MGCMYAEYAHLQLEAGMAVTAGTATGNSLSFMVGRLSYTFGLTGAYQAFKNLLCADARSALSVSLLPV